ERWKVGGDGRHQIGYFIGGDGGIGIQWRRAVYVGRANQGDAFPGKGKYRPSIDWMHETDGLGNGEAPGGKNEMAAAQGAYASLLADLHAQSIGPRASRVDNDTRSHISLAIVQYLVQPDTGQIPSFVEL